MSDIVLSAGIRSNLLSLQNTAKMLDKTQNRLATGLKVNSAIDDPTAFFTAQGLNNRARDLTGLLDSMDQAVQTLRAADTGIKSIIKLIENAKATANQALETKIISTNITGSLTSLTSATTIGSLTAVSVGDQMTFTIDGATYATSALTTGDTVSDILTKIRNAYSAVTATLTSSGAINIALTTGDDFTITGDLAGDLGVTGTHVNGTNRNTFETDFNALRVQVDELVADSSYKGVNLLTSNNNLTVYFNESQTSSLTIQSSLMDTSASGLNISQITGGSWATDADIRSAIDQLDQAVVKLRQQSSTFGGNLSVVETRADFTQQMVNTLETGASNLTIADTNEEGANLLALQTRQQLGSVALSLASQADQNVLQLF